jgi:ribosome-binding ATPase YchF (GTP1/OBG family)
MKIALFSLPEINPGKQNIKDSRLDQVDKLVKAKKKTYIQVELVGEAGVFEADAILVAKDARTDLVLKDLEFIETRLGRSETEVEKALLNKLKLSLEKEEFIFSAALNPEEKQILGGYSVLTSRPVAVADPGELADLAAVLAQAYKEAGFISFFTAGDKENRAWSIRQGATAWEASGAIHSDIQKGFIRAEIISYADFIAAGGETQAKQAGKQRLEQKDYVMQDADLANFRFNK